MALGIYKEKIERLWDYAGEEREKRVTRFENVEDFVFDENQWDDDDVANAGIKNDQEKLVINQIGDFVNEGFLSKLFPRDPATGIIDIGAIVKNRQEKETRKFEAEIRETYRFNKFMKKLLEQGRNFLNGGNAAVYYPWDEASKITRIFSVDPRTVFYRYEDNDLQEVMMVDRILNYEKGMLSKIMDKYFKPSYGYDQTRIIYWNKDEMFILENGKIKEHAENERNKIPFEWVANQPKPHCYEGKSEITDSLMKLQKEYNKTISSFGRRVSKNTKGKFAIKTNRELDDIAEESRDRELFKLDPGDGMEGVEFKENKEILDYASGIDQILKRSKGMNTATDGEIKSHVSGLAMQYAFAPLMDKIALRRVYFDELFYSVNEAIIYNRFDISGVEVQPQYNPIVTMDYSEKVKDIVKMRDLDVPLISLENALDQLHGADVSDMEKQRILTELKETEKRRNRENENLKFKIKNNKNNGSKNS